MEHIQYFYGNSSFFAIHLERRANLYGWMDEIAILTYGMRKLVQTWLNQL